MNSPDGRPRPSVPALAGGLAAAVAVVVAVFLFFEAAVEVEILCGVVGPGTPETDARAILATGAFLRVDEGPAGGPWLVRTPWDLGNARCRVTTMAGAVREARFTRRLDVARAAAWVGAALAAALVVFQVGLAAGAPWGALAWGGRHRGRLPGSLRLGSLVAAAVVGVGVGAVLERGGAVAPWLPAGLAGTLTAVLAGVFGLSILGNRLSASDLERRIQTPVAVVLAVTFLVVALSK